MRELRGKKALITGAASGIGRAIALEFARQGIDLFLVDVDACGLADASPPKPAPPASKSSNAAATSAKRAKSPPPSPRSSHRWGGVDILVNNAGITYYGRTDEMSAEHWDRLMRINLASHVQFTRELLPSLLGPPRSPRAQRLQHVRPGGHAQAHRLLHEQIRDGRLQRSAPRRIRPRRARASPPSAPASWRRTCSRRPRCPRTARAQRFRRESSARRPRKSPAPP